jgi:putative hemolysin
MKKQGVIMKNILSLSALMTFSLAGLSMPNPAAVFCVRSGGTYEVRTTTGGAEAGVCVFNQNGQHSECGAWSYFRAECRPGQCTAWSVDTNSCQNPLGDA